MCLFNKPGVPFGSVVVPLSAPFHAMSDYARMSLLNTRSAEFRVYDNILLENCMARMQSLSTYRNIICDRLVNWQDFEWDDLWDEPVYH